MGVVQEQAGSTGAASAPTPYTVTLPSGTTAGNTLVIKISADITVATPAGFTQDNTVSFNNAMYEFRKTAVAGETSWAFTPGVGAPATWVATEFDNLTASPLDKVNSSGSTGGATTRSTGTTATTTAADETVECTWGGDSATTHTWSAQTNSVVEVADVITTNGGVKASICVGRKTVAATGAFESTATSSASVPSCGMVTTYKLAAAGTNATATPSAHTAQVAFGTSAVTVDSTASPTPLARAVGIPAPTVTVSPSATPAALAMAVAFGAPTVSAGASATVSPASLGLVWASGTPTLVSSPTAAPGALSAPVAIPTPIVSTESLTTVSPSGLALAGAFPQPTVLVSVSHTVTPDPVAMAVRFGPMPAPVEATGVAAFAGLGDVRRRARYDPYGTAYVDLEDGEDRV